MYDPKFSVKQMYDQYGSSRTKKADPKPSKSSGFGGMGPDPAERFGGSPTRGLGSKPDYSSSAYDSGGADNNPNRDVAESMGVVKKVLDRAVTLFRNFGADEPEDVIVDGKRVYKGPLFRGFDPTTSIGDFGGEYGKKQYLFGMPSLGEVTPRSPTPPTLPPADTNPTLNMFGVTRGFARNPDPFLPPDPMVQPKTGIDTYAEMKQSIDKTLEGVVSVDYTIKRGDTLSEIAQDRGTTVDVLLKMNDIKEEDKDTIFAGEKLKVPPKKAKTYKDIVDDLYASSDQIMSDAYDPDSRYYQSQIPMDQRDFAPEDLSGFGGMGPDPSVGQPIIRGLMSKVDDDMGLPYTRSDTEQIIALEPMFKFIEKGEGDYNSSNRGTIGNSIKGATNNTIRDGKKLTEMTIGEIKAKQTITDPNNPERLFAVGRFQTIPTTLDMAIDDLDLSDDTIFNENTQDRIGMYLITQKRPKVGRYLAGDNSVSQDEAMLELAKEFASFPVPYDMTIRRKGKDVKLKKGDSYYGSGNKAQHTFEEVEDELDKLRGNM